MLVALGADLSAEGLREAPRRMAGDVAELLTPQLFKLTMFANEERYDELAVTRSIPFQSLCMHHRLSFFGVVHIAPALHGIVRDDPRTRQESLSLTQRSTP
ncbi:MAG: GTP cyclohydrolase I [Solirubrobacteraceae bacterium]